MSAFNPVDMACNKAVSTAELVMKGGASEATGMLVPWIARDPPDGCVEEFPSSGVTSDCM